MFHLRKASGQRTSWLQPTRAAASSLLLFWYLAGPATAQMVLVMESDGSLTPSRSQNSFARNYNDGIGQGSAADELAILGEDEPAIEPDALRFAALSRPAPLPRADVLTAIEATALRYAGHPGLRGADLCEISGYGRTGPYADKGGFDLVAQGMSGLMSITGESKDKPPMKVGAPITDITAGLLAASGILAALVHREKTGEGQKVDTSLYEAGIVHTYWQSAIAGATGESPGPLGSAHPLTAPYQAFKTKDKWITVGASNQNTWLMLLKAIGREDLQENEKFSSNLNRKQNLKELVDILNEELIKKTSSEWLKIFDDNGLPCGPINSITDMFKDPQTIERQMVIEVNNKKAGKSKAIGMPIKFSKSKTEKSKGAPNLGEHTKQVMQIFGYNDDQIKDFYDRKVIV